MGDSEMRQVTTDDVDGLVDLHIAAFGNRDNPESQLRAFYAGLIDTTSAPDTGAPAASLVVERDGQLNHMILATTSEMKLGDRRLVGSAPTLLAARPGGGSPLQTRRLLRRSFDASGDYVFADRVNDLGRRAGAAVSMEFYPAYSVRWGRVLRAGTGLAGGLLNRRPAMGRLSRSALAMTAKAVDAASGATGLFARSGQKYIKATVRRPLAASELAAAGDSVIAAHGPIQSLLRPDFQEELVTKRWQLLDRLRPEGVKHHVGVWDPDGQLVGWYLLHCWPTNTAEVVDLVSTPERSHAVVAHVLDQAYDLGVGSVHGGVHPAMQFALTDAGAYFHGRASSTGLYAKCQDLHQAFRQCRAFPSALQGEYPLQVPRQGRVAA